MHEAPGLAQPHRRRMARDFKQRIDSLARDRIGAKAPDVAPPQDEVAELRTEHGVERRCHACRLSMKWKNVPLTEPRRPPPSATGAPVASRHSTSGSSSLESALA